jgi:hypothetical protein
VPWTCGLSSFEFRVEVAGVRDECVVGCPLATRALCGADISDLRRRMDACSACAYGRREAGACADPPARCSMTRTTNSRAFVSTAPARIVCTNCSSGVRNTALTGAPSHSQHRVLHRCRQEGAGHGHRQPGGGEGRRQTAAKLYRDRDPPFGVAVNQGQGPWPWQRRLEA